MGFFGKKNKKDGMGVFSGDALADQLISQQAVCKKCASNIPFEDGVLCAREANIPESVVKCRKCGAVYRVQLLPGKMLLKEEVTHIYPQNN